MALPNEEIAALASASAAAVQGGERWERIVLAVLQALVAEDSAAVRAIARVGGSFPQRRRRPPPS